MASFIFVLGSLAAIATFVLTIPFFIVRSLPKNNNIELLSGEIGQGSGMRLADFTLRLKMDSFKIVNVTNKPIHVEVNILPPKEHYISIKPDYYTIKPYSSENVSISSQDISREEGYKLFDSYLKEHKTLICKLQVSCSTIFALPYIRKYKVKFELVVN